MLAAAPEPQKEVEKTRKHSREDGVQQRGHGTHGVGFVLGLILEGLTLTGPQPALSKQTHLTGVRSPPHTAVGHLALFFKRSP